MKKAFTFFSAVACCSLLSGSVMASNKGHDPDHNHDNPYGMKRCGTMEYLEMQKQQDPTLESRMQKLEEEMQAWINANIKNPQPKAIIRIPTVVHVVYANSAQNVSDTKVCSQIDVLNKDFRKMNSEATTAIPQLQFANLAADCEIEFCLATKDPNGNPTNGITRTSTTVSSFGTNDAVKYTSQGGKDIWNRDNYLNIWVCNLSSGLLGYAQFPGGAAATDGVVLLYSSLPGNSGPYGLGRSGTHEVGHWLNLRHIWGDANCGNDQVSDTPPAEGPHYSINGSGPPSGCATHPYHVNQCGSGTSPQGEMTMNFMDYTDDKCMYMFTTGQKTRMVAAINTFRSGLNASSATNCGSANLPSPPCATTAINDILPAGSISIYPNPSSGEVIISTRLLNISNMELKVYNAIGEAIITRKITVPSNGEIKVNLNDNPDGVYLFEVNTVDGTITKKIVINR